MKTTALMISVSVAAGLLSGCAALGGTNSPDEFRVVKKAPLVVPPDFSLRPPDAGAGTPFEVDETRASVTTVFGDAIGQNASPSERALVAAAGANAVNPIIRDQVDWEEAAVIRKSQRVSDRVMNWDPSQADDTADSATGGAEVEIARGSGDRLKLPGT